MKIPIVTNLGEPRYLLIAVIVALLFLSANIFLMANLPGERNNSCYVGGSLTTGNIVFSGSLSILMGMFAAGLYTLIAQKQVSRKTSITAVSGIGFALGPLTVFCALCTIPVISLFGLSTLLNLLNQYNLVFKLLSITAASAGLYLLNQQLMDQCKTCMVKTDDNRMINRHN